MSRLDSERDFHDRQARERAAELLRDPGRLVFADDDYLDHETWVRPAFDLLGDVAGRRVLDFGCGHGMAAVVLARRGARVTAFDLSEHYVNEALARARANGVSAHFVQTDGERLPFSNASFDLVWGNAILHHLDLCVAGRELRRVMRPGGVAVFCEPWGENPLLNFARSRLPYPGKQRTVDEKPLRWADLQILAAIFPSTEVHGFQLLSMARRVWPRSHLVRWLQRCDTALLTRWPQLQRFCRYVVVVLRS
jgi:2-polyprenyl-3-methyl-5-hydroxy-6-metoxy-1,4-benzoquinol methylase